LVPGKPARARATEWDAAADYLEACTAFWNPEPLQDWVRQLRERQMPESFQE
jgi:hypothetical protein